ncbi:MAG: pyridoxine 5'-phosphate synthase [Elusimicrobia bacterium]|nr:pyridoxine 5'-phosphate synthase [Elusimicrobiota bacterium]
MINLGVNIDHLATLRQARKASDPDLVAAARVCRSAGADLLVVHLRQDRRHIQEEDLFALRRQVKLPLHLEMSPVPEMVRVALSVKPDSVCLVPEHSSEITTRQGLPLRDKNLNSLEKVVEKLRAKGMGVSLFVDPDAISIRKAKSLSADTVELCTADYATTWGNHRQKEELEKLELAGCLVRELGMDLHAGHGLDYHNVAPVAKITGLSCLNIGFSIVSRAVFVGLRNAVAEMKQLIRN